MVNSKFSGLADCSDSPHQCFASVATINDNPIGFIVGNNSLDSNDLYIEFVIVDPDYQRKGICRQLLRNIEEIATKNRCKSISLLVNEVENRRAKQIYESFGFKEEAPNSNDRTSVEMIKHLIWFYTNIKMLLFYHPIVYNMLIFNNLSLYYMIVYIAFITYISGKTHTIFGGSLPGLLGLSNKYIQDNFKDHLKEWVYDLFIYISKLVR